MGNWYKDSEHFEAAVRVAYRYWVLKGMMEENERLSPLERMVDEVTGYGREKFEKWRGDVVELMEGVIEDKRFLGEDVDEDLRALERVKGVYSAGDKLKK